MVRGAGFRIEYLPLSMISLFGETADDNKKLCGSNASLSSVTRAENPSLSESGPLLQLVWKNVRILVRFAYS